MEVQKFTDYCVLATERQGVVRNSEGCSHWMKAEAEVFLDAVLLVFLNASAHGETCYSRRHASSIFTFSIKIRNFGVFINWALLTWYPMVCFAELLSGRQNCSKLYHASFFKLMGLHCQKSEMKMNLKAIWNTSWKMNQWLHKDKWVYLNKQKTFSLCHPASEGLGWNGNLVNIYIVKYSYLISDALQ